MVIEVTDEPNVTHWTCSSCGRKLTYVNDDHKIEHHTHFDITRSNKELEADGDEIHVVESNLKMERELCETCFLRALNESPTLGKLFYDGEKFIY